MTPTYSPLLDALIDALRCLPGVGPRTAQRMAFYLLEKTHREPGKNLAHTLQKALEQIGQCQQCRTYTENKLCKICENPSRDHKQLCIVESPADVLAIEQTHSFKGYYHVLMGHLSPLDGIGPEDLELDKLLTRIKNQAIQEVILATNSTIEGEATAHYIITLLKPLAIKISRIANGVPMGGELEFVDGNTLVHAFKAREVVYTEK